MKAPYVVFVGVPPLLDVLHRDFLHSAAWHGRGSTATVTPARFSAAIGTSPLDLKFGVSAAHQPDRFSWLLAAVTSHFLCAVLTRTLCLGPAWARAHVPVRRPSSPVAGPVPCRAVGKLPAASPSRDSLSPPSLPSPPEPEGRCDSAARDPDDANRANKKK